MTQSEAPSLSALGKFRHRCPLCQRSIAGTHFKRHLAAHDRRVAPGTQPAPGATSAAWLAFLDGRLRDDGSRP